MIPNDSATLQHFDPRAKLILVLSISSLAVAFNHPIVLLPLSAVTFLAARFFGVQILRAMSSIRRLLWVFVAMGMIQSVFTPGGEAVLAVGGISLVSTVGLVRGVSIILRIVVIVVSAAIMTTANPRDIVQGLSQWRIPYEITFMVAVVLRFLPLMREEAEDTLTALQLRGVRLETLPLRTKIRIYRHLLYPLIANVLSRAEKMSISVEMRGFRAYPQRTSHRNLVFSPRDYGVIATSILIVMGVLLPYYWNWLPTS